MASSRATESPAGPAPTTATRSSRGLICGHDVGDARGLVPLDEEPLHRPDGERPVDVAAAAGALARRRADVRAHRRDRVRLAREDVALLEPALGGEVQVAAAVRADGTRFLALDVALQPGGVDGLDEEFLVRIDGQAGSCLSAGVGLGRGVIERASVGRPESTIRARGPARTGPGRGRSVRVDGRALAADADPRGGRPARRSAVALDDARQRDRQRVRLPGAWACVLGVGRRRRPRRGPPSSSPRPARGPSDRHARMPIPRRRGRRPCPDAFAFAAEPAPADPPTADRARGPRRRRDRRTGVRLAVGPDVPSAGVVVSTRPRAGAGAAARGDPADGRVPRRSSRGRDPMSVAMQRRRDRRCADGRDDRGRRPRPAVAHGRADGPAPRSAARPAALGRRATRPPTPDRARCAASPTNAARWRPARGPGARPRRAARGTTDVRRRTWRRGERRRGRGRSARRPDSPRRRPRPVPPTPAPRPVSPEAVEAAARDWLNEINRINAGRATPAARSTREREAAAAIGADARAARPRGRRGTDQGRDGRGGLRRCPRALAAATAPSATGSPGRPPAAAAERTARPRLLRGVGPGARRGREAEPLGAPGGGHDAGASSGCCGAIATRWIGWSTALAGDDPAERRRWQLALSRAGRRDRRRRDRGRPRSTSRPSTRSGARSARSRTATSRPPWPRSAIGSTASVAGSTSACRASATCRWPSATPASTRCGSVTGRPRPRWPSSSRTSPSPPMSTWPGRPAT